MSAERYLEAEFSFEPSFGATLDALYLARPELRSRMAALLGASVAGTAGAVGTALAGAQLFVWLACLAFAAIALAMLGWWALLQSRGSVFASGPGMARVDDHGLLVRPAGGEPIRMPWSSLRGWVGNDKVVVLLPADRSGRPLHPIPAAAIEASDTAPIFRELLHWHLGKPKR